MQNMGHPSTDLTGKPSVVFAWPALTLKSQNLIFVITISKSLRYRMETETFLPNQQDLNPRPHGPKWAHKDFLNHFDLFLGVSVLFHFLSVTP